MPLPLVLALLAAAPEANLLSLEAGGLAVETPQAYGGGWSPERLVDADPSTGWCSADNAKGPWRFVYELEQRSELTAVEVDNSKAEEDSFPGISASGLEVWVSSTGPADGFIRVATVALKRAGSARATFPKGTLGRWVRLVVPGSLGDKRYTELMEVSVTGRPLEPAEPKNLTGTWAVEGGGRVRLESDGGAVKGCAVLPVAQAWELRGVTHGRAAKLTWQSSVLPEGGTLFLLLADDGTLQGRWGSVAGGSGDWVKAKRTDAQVNCEESITDMRFARRLLAEQRGLTLAGVSFDAADELRLEVGSDLPSLERLLAPDRGRRARILVLGRTSEPATDEFRRCERRAQSLLRHLQRSQVAPSAYELGVGLLKVGAAVQLEPRVEVIFF
jgi:hypothetical protein